MSYKNKNNFNSTTVTYAFPLTIEAVHHTAGPIAMCGDGREHMYCLSEQLSFLHKSRILEPASSMWMLMWRLEVCILKSCCKYKDSHYTGDSATGQINDIVQSIYIYSNKINSVNKRSWWPAADYLLPHTII